MSKMTLLLKELDCPQCAEKIEKRVGELSGVKSSNLDFINKKLTVDFDGDTFDDQVVAVRKAGSPYLFLIVGLYNPDTNSYGRSAEIATEISKVRTFL